VGRRVTLATVAVVRVRWLVMIGLGMALVGCTQATASSGAGGDDPATERSTVAPAETATTTSTTIAAPAPSDEPTTTVPATTSTTVAPTTSTTVPALDVYDAGCVVQVQPGESLGVIVAARADELVTVASVQAENSIDAPDLIDVGQLLDVCIDNGLDDITGEQRLDRNAAVVAAENFASVAAQQTKLNELLTPFGYPEMPVDGDSGPVTRRGLCAARLAMGLAVNRQDMAAASLEENFLFAVSSLATPQNVTSDGRWVFIDVTCQVMFIGEGPNLVFVFPTSTGEPGHETRLQERARAFRYNPATSNGGWHNSSVYPVADDNPLNGNMYKPIYFDRGQAIHGANSVPTSPQSKGCTRLRPEHQDMLVDWLGLGGASSGVGAGTINVAVTVRGDYAAG
jgi:hypothetical protein